ncbi:Spi family protease inhibitor [Algoriphagus sp. AGSA1]|uniref:Spi family protease inhibitor n=1 Tax=Algoriphagus sp. AGSA1 TaxID=2907213 RepID=UPI001F200E55|nr:Spi family protease inhibitor [Algoriphagus sp. AGSA1]MCE7053102.1 Spi family protease inhibitor [Algoriphagus sp. AGSA1]
MKTRIFKLSILFLIFQSCAQVDIPDEVNIAESLNKLVDDRFTVSKDFANEIGVKFWRSNENLNSKQGIRKVRSIEAIKGSDLEIDDFFVINYEDDKGFALISADLRAVPVIAYSEKGSLSGIEMNSVNGLKIWFEEAKSEMKRIRLEVNEIHPIVKEQWVKYASTSEISSQINGRTQNTNCEEWYTIGQYMCQYSNSSSGPLFSNSISWGQSGITNWHAPSNSSCTCQRSPIGCGPVAIAQTLYWFQTGPYSYSGMPQYSNYSCTPVTSSDYSLASLMIDIKDEANTLLNFLAVMV